MDLKDLKNIYFLGIGGIGMSALARYFHTKGLFVSGYDKTPTALTDQLQQEGIQIHFNEDTSLIPDKVDLVVYTPAIPETNKEYQYVIKNNYRLIKRAQLLGLITRNNFTIAIAGTHGKTSISALISHILKYNGIKITAFIGGLSKNFNSNFIHDKGSEIVVVEADEFDRSFLNLAPDISIVTAIDADHLDIYTTGEQLRESFLQFMNRIKPGGFLIIKEGLIAPEHFEGTMIRYSAVQQSDCYITRLKQHGLTSIFSINIRKEIVENIKLQQAGIHNVENTLAAFVTALQLGLNPQQIKKAIESFRGVERRFDIRVNHEDVVYIDDYAHHPEELRAIISALKDIFPDRKITGIFQPHLYSRTSDFADEFADSLELLDELLLMEIYPARELPLEGVNSKWLFDKIKIENKTLCSENEVLEYLGGNRPEVLLTLGAGDIDQLVDPIEKLLLAS